MKLFRLLTTLADDPMPDDLPDQYLCLDCSISLLLRIELEGGNRVGIDYQAQCPLGTTCSSCGIALPESVEKELGAAELLGAA